MRRITQRTGKRLVQTFGVAGLVLLLLTAFPGRGQGTGQTPPPFEVASVRLVGQDHGMTVFPQYPSAQFSAENMSLTLLIAIAYGISDNQISGKPDWLDSTLYSVKAKPEGDAALTQKQYMPLLQQLLKDRFKLALHRETREVPGYALVVAKGGSKLKPVEESDAMAYILADGLRCPSISVKGLAGLLSRPLERPVVDHTGLIGTYKLDLSFAPASATDSPLPSLFTAVQEQLGLKLESQKVPEEFIVIDHVEKIPTEN